MSGSRAVDGDTVEIGVFGGTGVYDMDKLEDVTVRVLETPYGAPSSEIRVGTVSGRRVAFLARHGRGHAHLPTEINYRANVHAFKQLGVSRVLSVGAVGSLREELPPRTLVVPDQFFDRTRHRPDTFFGEGVVAHVSLADPFSQPLRLALMTAAVEAGQAPYDGGTYVCMEGPQFSTRAESVFYAGVGGSIIGMTALSEARLCREAEMAYGLLSLVTDYDAWRPHADGVEAGEILAVLRDNAHVAHDVLYRAIGLVPAGPLPENRALDTALVTQPGSIPAATRERLGPLLARVLAARS